MGSENANILVLVGSRSSIGRNYFFPHILLCTSVTTFPSWEPVSINLMMWSLSITRIKVLSSVILLISIGGSIEVVEHQIHILHLYRLQMVLYVLISMYFNFYVSISLPRHCTRFIQIFSISFTILFTELPLFLLLFLLIVTHIECFSSEVSRLWFLALVPHLLLLLLQLNISLSVRIYFVIVSISLYILLIWIIEIVRSHSKLLPSGPIILNSILYLA